MSVTKQTDVHVRITEKTLTNTVRKRVQFPTSDLVVAAWLEAQENLSVSIRLLIHDEVAAHGTHDRVNRIGSGAAGAQSNAAPAPSPTSPVPGASDIAAFLARVEDLRTTFSPLLSHLGDKST